MFVLKGDCRKEPVHFDKITSRISRLAYGLNPEFCDPILVSQKVTAGVYKGVTTSELDELAAETAASMTTTHPDYALLAARIAVSNLHKNTLKSFSETVEKMHKYVNPKTGQKSPLVDDEVHEIIMANKERLDSEILYDRDSQYDFFGYKTLERSYLLRLNGKVVERPQHMLMRVSVGIHKHDIDAAVETYHMLSERWFTHASPTLFNAGTPRPQLSSCFLLTMKDDSIEGIYDTLKECAVISKSAGGIGLSIHNIRSTSSYIRGTNGTSNGIVPMLRVFNDTARYVDQGGGKRKGAFAIYLEPWHGDIFEWLDLRKNHGKEGARARPLLWSLDQRPFHEACGGQWGVVPLLPEPGAWAGRLLGRGVRCSLRKVRARGPRFEGREGAAAVVRHYGGPGGDWQPLHALQGCLQPEVQPAEPGDDQVLQPLHGNRRVLLAGGDCRLQPRLHRAAALCARAADLPGQPPERYQPDGEEAAREPQRGEPLLRLRQAEAGHSDGDAQP